MKRPTPIQITPQILEILQWLSRLRFMDSEMIRAVIEPDPKRSPQEAQDRKQYVGRLLKRMRNAQLIEIPRAYWGYRNIYDQLHYVYALRDRGAQVLSERLGLELADRRWHWNNHRFKDLRQLRHSLMVSRFLTALYLALRSTQQAHWIRWDHRQPLTPQQWEDLPQSQRHQTTLWLSGEVVKAYAEMAEPVMVQGLRRTRTYRKAVIPDAFLGLHLPSRPKDRNKVYFALEVETGSRDRMKTFTNKLKAHWQLWKQRAYEQKFGIQRHRVLVITPTEATKENRRRAAKEADDRREGSEMFLFTSEERYSLRNPQALCQKIWQSPKDDRFHSILE